MIQISSIPVNKSRQYFTKRIYNITDFIQDIRIIVRKRAKVFATLKGKRLSPQFIERIMMAVTSVNQCTFCTWVHSKMALTDGCSDEEISEIISGNINNCQKEEAVALAFAQHYAESKSNPDRDAIKRLIEYYGREKAMDIIHYIRMITIGNLTGNTLSAFESRLAGIPPKKGSLWFEFLVYLIGFPFYFLTKGGRLGNKYISYFGQKKDFNKKNT